MSRSSNFSGRFSQILLNSCLSLLIILSQTVSPIIAIAHPFEPLNPKSSALVDTITGTLIGRVLDANRNGFPGVRVRVTNQDTGNQRTTLTDAEGRYQIAFLPLGKYSIEATKGGFIVVEPTKEPIRIQLNKPVEAVPDIVMGPVPVTPAPPTVASTQAVQEEAPGRLTNQVDPARRANADETQVSTLPLFGIRTFDDLALLAAGVAPPPQVKGVAGPGIGSGIGTAGQFSVNGQRARSNNFTVDGSDNNDEDVGVRRQGFVALVPQSIESIKEIQIVTHLWDTEQGRNLGSQVNAVSKSGGNQVHGAIYDFFNHDSLNARNFFDYTADRAASYPLNAIAYQGFSNGSPINPRLIPVIVRPSSTQFVQPNPSNGKDQYQRNQGGGVIGFPIIQDQTFFFGSFERQDIKARQETHFAVPTVAQRGFLNFGASGFCITAQCSQAFFPTFIAGDSIFSLFPFPNNPIGPYGDNTFTQILPADAHGTIFSLKLDHNFRLFGPEVTHNFAARYNFTDDERQVPSVGGAIFAGVMPKVKTQNLSLSLTSQLSPSMANQLRVSYGRTRLNFDEIRDPYLQSSQRLPNDPFLLNARLILNSSTPLIPQPFVEYQFNPGQNVTEDNLGQLGQVIVSPFSPVGLDVYLFPQSRANNTIQFADTLTYFRAEHTYKFGFDIRRTQLNSSLNRNYRPQVFFGGSPDLTSNISTAPIKNISSFGPTPGFFSGSDLAALGIPTGIFQSLAIGTPNSTIGLRSWQFNLFANNNWRARRGLTLDYGLRYEFNTVPHDVNNRIENTFALDQLPQPDPSLSIARPLISATFDNQRLIGAYNATIDALRQVLGGRTEIYQADRNNFGGHIGFAWDPFASNINQAGRTVIRGGAGVYYDVILGSVVSQSRNVFPNFVPLNIDVNTFAYANQIFFVAPPNGTRALINPRFIDVTVVRGSEIQSSGGLIVPNQLNAIQAPSGVLPALLGLLFNPSAGGTLPSGGGLAFTLPDNNLRSPIAFHYNLQIERELLSDFLVNLAYVGSRGVKLTRFRTPNGGVNSITVPVDPLGISFPQTPIAIAFPPMSADTGLTSRPIRNLGAFSIFDSSAASTYHSLQASLTKRFSKGYQLTAAYAWSHALDDVSDVFDLAGAFVLPQDDRNLSLEHGSANFDIRHRFTLSAIGNLPFLNRFNDSDGATRVLLGGWQFGLLQTLQTGQPFTVNTSFDINLDGNLTDRIDTLVGLNLVDSRQQKLQLTTNPVNLVAQLGSNGRIGRNTFRASGVAKTDFSLIKNFRLSGEQNLVFRAEAFNLFNRTHFAIPVRILEAPGFGNSVDTLFTPRQIQFALKYVF
jgi:Carboxypeptidase regulatory-like domain